jgi:hypothetical protein
MKICWNFPDNNDGKISGISEAGIETFRGDLLKSLAKEICQNSLDAIAESKDKVLVEFELYELPFKNDERIIGLKEYFKLAKEYWQENEKTIRILEKAEKNFERDKIRILRISDYNTTGLIGSDKKKNSTWNNLVKSSGVSDKTGSSGGSYGIGKSAPFACSDLRTVFYNTLDINGLEAFQGVANLVSFEKEKDKTTQGTGYYGNSEDNTAIRNMEYFGSYIRKDCGTDIYVVAFLEDEEWEKKIIEAILENFLIAILKNNIEVKVGKTLINKESLNSLMEEHKDNILLTYNYYQVLMENDTEAMEFSLRDLGIFKLYLSIKKDFKRTILISRSNGMKIFDKKGISSSIEFSGVCILEDEKINAYFREMETPQHDNWQTDRHRNPKEAEKVKKEFFKLLKEKVLEKGKETITDEMDAVGMGEYLPDIQDANTESENKKENIENVKKKFEYKKITTVETAENDILKVPDTEEQSFINELNEDGEIEDEISAQDFLNTSDEKENIGNGTLRNGDKLENSKFKHISPSSIRVFKVFGDSQEEMYKMIFSLDKDTKNIIIAVSIAGEQGNIPIMIKDAKESNGEILKSRYNKIEMRNLFKNSKYSILFSLNDSENYPVEVKIYGDKI